LIIFESVDKYGRDTVNLPYSSNITALIDFA
jgi:hypothetical protein